MSRTSSPSDPIVLDVLQRPNPAIIDICISIEGIDHCIPPKKLDLIELSDSHPAVRPWTDFSFEAISLAYGDILDMSLRTLREDYWRVSTPPRTPTTVYSMSSIASLNHYWGLNILRLPLKGAGSILRPRLATSSPDSDLSYWHKGVEWIVPTHPEIKFAPDWTILEYDLPILTHYREDHPSQPAKPLVYAVGRTQLAQKWKSSWLALPDDKLTVTMDPPFTPLNWSPSTPEEVNQTRHVGAMRLLPLKQAATFCRFAQTRYAFVLTQTELVALRVRRLPTPEGVNTLGPTGYRRYYAGVEYKVIPWGDGDEEDGGEGEQNLECEGEGQGEEDEKAEGDREGVEDGQAEKQDEGKEDLEWKQADEIGHAAGPQQRGLTTNLAVWALACMGMNDEHREMELEKPRNAAMEGMARLTWWRYDRERDFYENVISKRRIEGKDWKEEYNEFVELTKEGGMSWTRDFLPKAP